MVEQSSQASFRGVALIIL